MLDIDRSNRAGLPGNGHIHDGPSRRAGQIKTGCVIGSSFIGHQMLEYLVAGAAAIKVSALDR